MAAPFFEAVQADDGAAPCQVPQRSALPGIAHRLSAQRDAMDVGRQVEYAVVQGHEASHYIATFR